MKANPQRLTRHFRSHHFRSCLILAGVAFCITPTALLRADSFSVGVLNLENFSVTPSAGTVSWVNPNWSISTFAEAANSLGELSQSSGTVDSFSVSSASVTFASSLGAGSVPASSGLFGQVVGISLLPGGFVGHADTTSRSSLANSFNLTGIGFVNVSFDALISGSLEAFADTANASASVDAIFNLTVDGQNVLTFSDALSVNGPNGHATDSGSTMPANSISLDSSLTHTILLEIDTETAVTRTTVPDQNRTLPLLLAGLGVLGLFRVSRGNPGAARETA